MPAWYCMHDSFRDFKNENTALHGAGFHLKKKVPLCCYQGYEPSMFGMLALIISKKKKKEKKKRKIVF